MTSTAVLQQVLNTASAQGFVVVAKTAFQPAKPVTLKEVLERLDLQAISRINTSQLSQVLKSDMGDADENPTKKLMLLQSDMDLTDQEHLRVMQTLEGAKLATIDIVGPEMFGIVVGEGELKHTFKKSGNILLIDNYAGKEIIKISGELLIPNSPEKRPSFSELVPEIRQLILAAAARLEVPREVVVTEYLHRINPQASAIIQDAHATGTFKLVRISKTILDDLLASGTVQKIQLDNDKAVYFNRGNDILRIQSCSPQYSTRLSLARVMNVSYLKSVSLEVNSFLARTRQGMTQSLQAMIALQTIIISGEVFTDHGPADENELVDVNLEFNRVLVDQNQPGGNAKMMPTWSRADGKVFEDRLILLELESELNSDFQGNPAHALRIEKFLSQLEILLALVTGTLHFAPLCTLVKVAIRF